MYPSNEDDDDLLAALCFDQSNGGEDPYALIQTDQENLFPDFGSSSVNLQPEQEQVCNNIGAQFDSFSGNVPQVCNFSGENNGLEPFGGVVYSSSTGSAQLDLGASYSGALQQEPHQVFSVRGQNDEQVYCRVVEINSSSYVVKEELEHVEEECSRKRGRTGSCSKPGTKACREKKRRELLNDKFMDLSSVLEPTRTPKTDKPAILDDAMRVVNQLRGEAHELKETNQKLLEEIKTLKAEKNELREEKLVLKADKENMEQRMKSMRVPSPGFMPSHPAAFHQNKMAVYPSYGYYPNMPMMPYLLPPSQRDTSHDQQNCSKAA